MNKLTNQFGNFDKKYAMRCIKMILLGILIIEIVNIIPTKATVPNEYIANYAIKDARDKTLGTFVEIDAFSKINKTIPSTKFVELNTAFGTLFGKLPQDYAFRVVYTQCNEITSVLSSLAPSAPIYGSVFTQFMVSCYKPFNDILKKINNTYTVAAKSKISPVSGPAPLSVTFDARGSVDPSGETIPSRNFFWYYRDTAGMDQVIGNGPVLSYNFEKEGNYVVHLTVRSSNITKGVLDGDQSISIDVAPKSAIISLYANGQKMSKDKKVKVGTMEAERGIVFDASSSIAMGGRQILSYHWSITSKEGFSYVKDGNGKPDMIRVILPGRGEYSVSMDLFDNENNKTTEKFELIASDPVAIVSQQPEKGNTSTTFGFDASTSYSILSSIKLYTREVFDQNGVKLETYQGKDIKQQFKKPGFYTVKLTIEDELGQTNIDTSQIYVESTDPLAQFTIKPALDWKHPSKFFLDATISSDTDKTNGYDDISYDWIFPDEAKARITQTEDNNGRITVEINSIGKFKIKLLAKDNFGKMGENEKEIEVKSTLRPEIVVAPTATIWGAPINFVVKTNEPILSYEWDFADTDTRTILTDKITHLYQKTGIYKVKLKVAGNDEMTNEVTKTVFIGEKNYPIAGYQVTDKLSTVLTQNEKCTEPSPDGSGSIENPAYQVDRYQELVVNPSDSVNTKGEKSDLAYYFQPKNKEIYKQNDFKYKFDELGCNYIDLTAEDTSIGKNNKTRIWFKVVNALPKIDNITLLFPQYGNQIGIGVDQNQVKDIFNSKFDPLIVKVSATSPLDPDGFISYFKWYYYLKDDPTRYIETKITPGDIPYAFFSLPKIPGEYSFGVTIYDNDDGKVASQDLIGNSPIVFFPPDGSRPDVPLVTLKMSQTTAEVGDEVVFDVISKIISDRPDFIKERTIYYDFDGDGTWDLVTKKDRVTYTYTKPSEISGFRPRASVLYRGYRGVSNGGTIIVKNGLKPRLLYTNFGNIALFRDISLGDISKKSICLDIKNCAGDNMINTGVAFSYKYQRPGKYFASIDLSDDYANEAKKRLVINISTGTSSTQDFTLLSIPEATTNAAGTEIFVGNNLDNTILFDVLHDDKRGDCYVDSDLDSDSNGNSNPTDDKDFICNEIYLKKYEPKYDSVNGRIYYSDRNGKLLSKDFVVSFIDFDVTLSPEDKKIYDQLGALLKEMTGPTWLTGNHLSLKNMIKDLKNNLSDKQTTMANIVSVKDYMSRNTDIVLSKEQDVILKTVFLELSNKATAAAEGLGEYGIIKADILSILPINLALEVDALFKNFESVAGDKTLDISQQDKRKEALQKIITAITKRVAPEGTTPTNEQIDKVDMDTTIMPNICKIMQIYNIPSATCNTAETKAVPDDIVAENGTSTKSGSSWLKVVFIVLGIFVGVFIILVVIFAVKAKINQEKEDNEGTPPTMPST